MEFIEKPSDDILLGIAGALGAHRALMEEYSHRYTAKDMEQLTEAEEWLKQFDVDDGEGEE